MRGLARLPGTRYFPASGRCAAAQYQPGQPRPSGLATKTHRQNGNSLKHRWPQLFTLPLRPAALARKKFPPNIASFVFDQGLHQLFQRVQLLRQRVILLFQLRIPGAERGHF